MAGKQTSAARAFVSDDCDGVSQLAAGLLQRLPEADASRVDSVLRRFPEHARQAVTLEQSWMRSSLASNIRRDLLDLRYYAMLYRERELAEACGRTLLDIDRRAQQEASPVFDPQE